MIEPTQAMTLAGRADCVGLAISARQLAMACGWPPLDGAALELLVVELTTNAVRHAGAGECRIDLDGARAQVDVRDAGPGFPAWVLERHARSEHLEGAVPHRSGGLGAGLDCCARLADELKLENLNPHGAKAWAMRRRRSST